MQGPAVFDFAAPLVSTRMALMHDRNTQLHTMVFTLHWLLNVIALHAVNAARREAGHRQRSTPEPPRSTIMLLVRHHVLFFAQVIIYCYLDAAYPAPVLLSLPFQAYAGAFTMGVLDFYLCPPAAGRNDPRRQLCVWKILQGAWLWLACDWILHYCAGSWLAASLGGDELVLRSNVHQLGSSTAAAASFLAAEYGRFLFWMVGAGLCSDFFFSPLHRLTHRLAYARVHKQHHAFTSSLTSLVLFHGHALDDFLMPLTTVGGGLCVWGFIHAMGGAAGWQSTWQYYMVAFFLPYSHASEARLASLLVPGLPDSLNFIAYHRRHHIEPSRNFGLVLPTDILWDKLLGVRTVMLSDINVEKSK